MTEFAGLITRETGDRTIIEVDAQNIDFRNCETIKSAIQTIVSGGKKDIILNLGKVGFMDSSGLSILIYGKRLCDEVNGTFVMCSLQNYVNNLAQLTKLNKSINIYETEEQAVSSNN